MTKTFIVVLSSLVFAFSYFNEHFNFCFREIQFNGIILSTDEFFVKNGVYKFDFTKLSDAHAWNKKRGKYTAICSAFAIKI